MHYDVLCLQTHGGYVFLIGFQEFSSLCVPTVGNIYICVYYFTAHITLKGIGSFP